MRVEGKVAVVTGGSRGIGEGIVLTLAREGADVAIICQTHLELAREVADKVKALGRRALVIKCDISSRDEVGRMTKQVLGEFKRIDILVNNAGHGGITAVEDTTDDVWDSHIDINLKGTFLCCQIIGGLMVKQKYGKIINVASTLAYVGMPEQAAYIASKGGVVALSRALAIEWASHNINVNLVSPGMTDTPLSAELSEQFPHIFKQRKDRIPLRRHNKPEDIANAVLFLASPESDNVTGQDIIVDGGICAMHAGYIWPDR